MPRPNEETMTQSAQAVRREALTEVTLSPTRYVVSFRQACLPRACRSGNFEPNRDLVLNLKAWRIRLPGLLATAHGLTAICGPSLSQRGHFDYQAHARQ